MCGPSLRGGVTDALGLRTPAAEMGLGGAARSVVRGEGACGSCVGICTSGVGSVVGGGEVMLSLGIGTSGGASVVAGWSSVKVTGGICISSGCVC